MAEELANLIDFDLNNFKHLEYLQDNIYPSVNKSLEILIDHLIKTNEIQQHQERLKLKKIRDRAESKRIEKEKMREELGSAYESSSEGDPEEDKIEDFNQRTSQDDDLTMSQDPLSVQINTTYEKQSQGDEEDTKKAGSLAPIQEEELSEKQEEKAVEDDPNNDDLLASQNIFNPISFLAETLRKIRDGEIQLPSKEKHSTSQISSHSGRRGLDSSSFQDPKMSS